MHQLLSVIHVINFLKALQQVSRGVTVNPCFKLEEVAAMLRTLLDQLEPAVACQ